MNSGSSGRAVHQVVATRAWNSEWAGCAGWPSPPNAEPRWQASASRFDHLRSTARECSENVGLACAGGSAQYDEPARWITLVVRGTRCATRRERPCVSGIHHRRHEVPPARHGFPGIQTFVFPWLKSRCAEHIPERSRLYVFDLRDQAQTNKLFTMRGSRSSSLESSATVRGVRLKLDTLCWDARRPRRLPKGGAWSPAATKARLGLENGRVGTDSPRRCEERAVVGARPQDEPDTR